MTNREWLNQMTDKELARFLQDITLRCNLSGVHNMSRQPTCTYCSLRTGKRCDEETIEAWLEDER